MGQVLSCLAAFTSASHPRTFQQRNRRGGSQQPCFHQVSLPGFVLLVAVPR